MGKNQRLAVLARHTSAEPAAADAYTYPPLDLPAEVDATEKVIYFKKGHVAYVVINRPERMNACDYETYARLDEIWYDVMADDNVRVAILTGAGSRAFCAGSDIKDNYDAEFQSDAGTRSFGAKVNKDLPRLSIMSADDQGRMTKPIISAINGHANGGGFEQSLATDIRVCAEHAQFGLGEVRLGWLPGGGGTQRLPRMIPQGRAMEMLLTGNRLGADEAFRLGIVDHVVPIESLMEKCESIAHEICLSAPLAVQKIKEVVLEGLDMSLADGFRAEQRGYKWLNTTEDAMIGAAAFAQKETPQWTAKKP